MEKYAVMRKISYRKEKRTIGYIMWSPTSIICVDRAIGLELAGKGLVEDGKVGKINGINVIVKRSDPSKEIGGWRVTPERANFMMNKLNNFARK